MITIRRDDEIARRDGGWFQARWHFSFDDYHDPDWTSFGSLRVFNDDRLIPGAIWPLHPHRDIEGITYVVEGTFRHEDSLGNGGVLPAGSVQRMTLGSGAWHSEQNGSEDEPMRFIQMWIMPRERGLAPSVEQKIFTREDRTDRLLRVVSPDGGGAVMVHQDAAVFVTSMTAETSLSHGVPDGKGIYLYVIQGTLRMNGEELSTGDAAAIRDESSVALDARDATEIIMAQVRLDE
jgi:redox-sensitive bicupin YhaK (pirin superfamily)